MKHFKGYARYSKAFSIEKDFCNCGGVFSNVDLVRSDRKVLNVCCSNPYCKNFTMAHRVTEGPAFPGADLPRATL